MPIWKENLYTSQHPLAAPSPYSSHTSACQESLEIPPIEYQKMATTD
jgi:hypothetical protein